MSDCHAGCGREVKDAPFCCWDCYVHRSQLEGRMLEWKSKGEHSHVCDVKHGAK